MAKLCSLCFHMFLFLALQLCLQFAESHSTVEFLPGYEGPLPFELETGYVGVDKSEDVQIFYYFVKSENDPRVDPLILWLTGGPGCSALSTLMYEIGPLYFKIVGYNGSLPTLLLNPNSWTKVSNILFVDFPVGTGFSYARTPVAAHTGDFKQGHNAVEFLRKWLNDHPEFISNPVYIGGESYSGLTVPMVVQLMSNEDNIKPLINLQGYLMGNPMTIPTLEGNSKIAFSHGMGLISDELYESMKSSCGGEYQNIDPSNAECLKCIQAYNECVLDIEKSHILERHCAFASPRRYISEKKFTELRYPEPAIMLGCHTYGYMLSHSWANDETVQDALHVRKGSIEEWERCNYGLPYAYEIHNSFEYHLNLSAKGYRALIYSGDHDMIVPFLATQAWIRSLNYAIVDEWRPWNLKDQVAGYTRSYSNQMTFATVKGAGHTPPAYKPEECFAMFKSWISGQPL